MRSVPATFHTATKPCPHCGRPTFVNRFTAVTDEVAALLEVDPDVEVAEDCRDRAERDLDDAADALALDEDPAFAEVCDARHAGYLAHAMEHQGDDSAPVSRAA